MAFSDKSQAVSMHYGLVTLHISNKYLSKMTTGHKDWHNKTKGTAIITRVEGADSLMTLG